MKYLIFKLLTIFFLGVFMGVFSVLFLRAVIYEFYTAAVIEFIMIAFCGIAFLDILKWNPQGDENE